MKVKLIITNYVKFGKPEDIKIGNKVLLQTKYNNFPFLLSMKTWFGKIVTIDNIRSNGFKIKEDNGQYYWHKSRIKFNYSNYKFEVL